MSEPSFSQITDGLITAIQPPVDGVTMRKIKISEGVFSKRFTLYDTTGSGDTDVVFVAGCQFLYAFQGTGWYMTSADAHANLCGLAATDGSTNPVTRYGRVTVARRYASFQDVTAGGDAAGTRYFMAGRPIFYGQMARFQQDTERPFEASNPNIATLTVPFGDSTSIAGAAVIENISGRGSFRSGGAVALATPFKFSGTPTITAGCIFKSESFAAEIRLDNARKATGTVKLNQLSMTLDYAAQGKVPVSFSGVFHGAVTWADV
jgi:hypothetical protein